jgi:hypothetical protein
VRDASNVEEETIEVEGGMKITVTVNSVVAGFVEEVVADGFMASPEEFIRVCIMEYVDQHINLFEKVLAGIMSQQEQRSAERAYLASKKNGDEHVI